MSHLGGGCFAGLLTLWSVITAAVPAWRHSRDKRDDNVIVPPRHLGIKVTSGKKKRKFKVTKLGKIKPDQIWRDSRRFRKANGLTGPEHRSRFENFFSRRNDRSYITLQTATAAIIIASMGRIDREGVNNFRIYLWIKLMSVGTDGVTELWKDYVNRLQNSVFRSILEDVPKLDGTESKEVTELHKNICGASPDLERVINDDSPSEEQIWAVAHLAQTRFLPTPSFRKTREKIISYITGLIRKPETPDPDAYQAGAVLGQEARKCAGKNQQLLYRETHLSLSAGSCWEASRAKLGKWHTVLPGSEFIQYMEAPAMESAFRSEGDYYLDALGNRICHIDEGQLPFWKVAYLSTPLPQEKLGEVYKIDEDLRTNFNAGFDARFGQLLFSWASKRRAEHDEDYLKAKLIIISEPGGKIRPLTSGETWAYLYMVPAMHMLSEAMQVLPGARVGLADSDNLYRAGRSYKRHLDQRRERNRNARVPKYISSSDLTSATDNARWATSRSLLAGFIDATAPDEVKDYLNDAVDLCCSARMVTYKTTRSQAKKIAPKVEGEGLHRTKGVITFTTVTGVMMGDPITKVILTASSMAAWYCSCQGFDDVSKVTVVEYNRRKRMFPKTREKNNLPDLEGVFFTCAGDDHIVIGDANLCKRVPVFLESMGFEISWPKYRISDRYVHFCQDFGVVPTMKASIKIDTIRLRLLNEFRKMGSHKNFEHPDTLVGKAKLLEKFDEYLLEDYKKKPSREKMDKINFVREAIPDLLRACMPSFAEKKVMSSPVTYMPTFLGGLGVPSQVVWAEHEKCREVARCFHLKRLGFHATEEPEFFWHRGILVPACYEKAITGIEVKDFTSVWSRAKSAVVEQGHTVPSNRYIAKRVYREWVDISRPTQIVGQKESAYAAVFNGSDIQHVRRRQRARHLINATLRYTHKNLKTDGTVDFSQCELYEKRFYRSGTWVTRADFQVYLGVPFSSARTHFKKDFLGGNAGFYEPDHTATFDEEGQNNLFGVAMAYSAIDEGQEPSTSQST